MDSIYLGDKWNGYEYIKDRVRILSTLELNAMIEKYSISSGLSRKQFSVNAWGFPFIPNPEVRREYNNVRTAPRGVSVSFFGHPIYWIEPELTKRLENEGEQEWCIRMFFLIDAMGYWDKKCNFIDFLKVNDFSFDNAQIETYFRIADQNCETDSYALLSSKNMDVTHSELNKKWKDEIVRCFEIQDRKSKEVLKNQSENYKTAKGIIGENIYSWFKSFDEENSIWANKFQPNLDSISSEYNSRSKSGNNIVSDLYRRTNEVCNDLEKFIETYNKVSSVLEIPVQVSIRGNLGGAARISLMASYMSIASSKDNIRKGVIKKVRKEMNKALVESGNIGENGFDSVIGAMQEVYSSSWNRLWLALVNYNNLREGKEIFGSVVEMKSNFQSSSMSRNSNMGLRDIIGE